MLQKYWPLIRQALLPGSDWPNPVSSNGLSHRVDLSQASPLHALITIWQGIKFFCQALQEPISPQKDAADHSLRAVLWLGNHLNL
jgi:hypothetical protein